MGLLKDFLALALVEKLIAIAVFGFFFSLLYKWVERIFKFYKQTGGKIKFFDFEMETPVKGSNDTKDKTHAECSKSGDISLILQTHARMYDEKTNLIFKKWELQDHIRILNEQMKYAIMLVDNVLVTVEKSYTEHVKAKKLPYAEAANLLRIYGNFIEVTKIKMEQHVETILKENHIAEMNTSEFAEYQRKKTDNIMRYLQWYISTAKPEMDYSADSLYGEVRQGIIDVFAKAREITLRHKKETEKIDDQIKALEEACEARIQSIMTGVNKAIVL